MEHDSECIITTLHVVFIVLNSPMPFAGLLHARDVIFVSGNAFKIIESWGPSIIEEACSKIKVVNVDPYKI